MSDLEPAVTALEAGEPDEAPALKPRLARLSVKNFRCIGARPVVIDLDEIVVLVGPNNAGKSSILRAYEVIMCEGSSEGELVIDDFPNAAVVAGRTPEIELHTVVYDKSPGDKWCELQPDGGNLVKEVWTWASPGKPQRRGFNVEEGRWAVETDPEKVPWGAAGVAKAARPQPHRIDALDTPEVQTDEILRLLDAALESRLKAHQNADDDESDYAKLARTVTELQTKVVQETQEEIAKVQTDLSELVQQVFPGHRVAFDACDQDCEGAFKFFTAQSRLRMGPDGGFLSTIDKQGSGARRTLLWTALKLLADKGVIARPAGSRAKNPIKADAERPHLLLFDEPEICLHPDAIREACELLYGLPASGNWQVMITTHSPCFVDFARDNTTIVRVERTGDGEINGTTVFRPQTAQLSTDDKAQLKLLNLCDPYVAEFFFGGRTIVVEGDTESTAFSYIREMDPKAFRNIHVVRARGKATVVSLMKILNHFGTAYAVLHDSDRPTCMRAGKEITNPAWTKNRDIIREAEAAPGKVRVIASVPNFEAAYFGAEANSEKPYGALVTLRNRGDEYLRVRALLEALLGESDELPDGAVLVTGEAELDVIKKDLTSAST